MEILKKCPFCGENPDTSHIHLLWVEETQSFALMHSCHDLSGEFVGSVLIHGKTAEEVFQRWNDRIEEEG
jgi:hypothetical protein